MMVSYREQLQISNQSSNLLSMHFKCPPASTRALQRTRAVVNRPDVEADVRYNRMDDSEKHAYTARWDYTLAVSKGEPQMRLAELSLLVSAEDDAIMSHSTVRFPVQSYLDRIATLADDFDKQRLQQLQRVQGHTSKDVVHALESFLYDDLKIECPAFGRSNLPSNSRVDHPGVYEDARWAYLDQLLIRKRGHKSIVAILLSSIVQILLKRGRIDFSITVDLSQGQGQVSTRPRVFILPRAAINSSDAVLNTCSSDTLRESLAHLKRSFWPLQWDTTQGESARIPRLDQSSRPQEAFGSQGALLHGGFLPGAKAALGEAMSAQVRFRVKGLNPNPGRGHVCVVSHTDPKLRAISTVANWRLERGIWTSPGAGDWRRCRAASERLLILSESVQNSREVDLERRDLGVLLMMSGELDQAYVELEAYESSSTCSIADGVERVLVKRMLDSLVAVNVRRGGSPVGLASTLSGPDPSQWSPTPTKRPLTW